MQKLLERARHIIGNINLRADLGMDSVILEQWLADHDSNNTDNSVLQNWLMELPLMQQTVLLTAIRGPDGLAKYHPVKKVLRWFRRCILLSAMDKKIINHP